ncbi:hypothetical protein WJX81_006113 [Elliptochloris bilobata]|uniref:Uncharacterized protein n=1 Tax=Elliptochloris bilobata TaxID=381761 RepID=A0AAW1SID4_9CHLO
MARDSGMVDLFSKVAWGGVWGAFLFLIPLRKVVARWWVRALVYGCGPSLVQILVVFPLTTPYGVGGVGLGALTPAFVFVFNTVGWSIPAYAYFRLHGFEDVGRASHSRANADDALLPS